MEVRNIETLTINPNNDHGIDDAGKRLLLIAMSRGDHGAFLITPEGMIINGNNRFKLREEAGWSNKEVNCRVLTAGQDDQGLYAVIDGVTVLDHEVIPFHYVSLDAMYHAYGFDANAEAAHYDKSIAGKFTEWQLDPNDFQANFFPPKSVQETLDALKKAEQKKKYQIIIPCTDETDMDAKYQAVTQLGYTAKRKI